MRPATGFWVVGVVGEGADQRGVEGVAHGEGGAFADGGVVRGEGADDLVPGFGRLSGDAIQGGEDGVAREAVGLGEPVNQRADGLRVANAAQGGGGAEAHGGVGVLE